MEITNIPAEKEIFTAKTDLGFVGCCRIDQGIVFTSEVFPKALVAANAARRLKKELNTGTKPTLKAVSEVTKKPTASKKNQKSVKPLKQKGTKRSKKSLTYACTLYTAEEIETMPLLSFREVWVITRYGDYVSDALNHEKKRLVAYCGTKESAKPYGCHEEAKRVMRTLKGVVGPGFNLQRFFVRID